MEPIKKASEKGLIITHPSSKTLFLIEELIGRRPEGVWVCGLVLPNGMCINMERRKFGLYGRLVQRRGAMT